MKISFKSIQGRPHRSLRDVRFWLGIFFIVVSILVSQSLISKATARTQAVVLVNEVPMGSEITSTDLKMTEVYLPASSELVALTSDAVGLIATRDLFVGDILTKNSVINRTRSELRMVSVPIKAGHLPNIDSGQLVDVWVTPSTDGMALPGPAQVVISQASIQAVPNGIDPAMDTAVTLLIQASDVQALVQAMRDGVIDLVALPENRRSLS